VVVEGKLPCTVVTGGGRGLGRLLAARMVRHTPVVLVGRDRAALASTAAELAASCGSGGGGEVRRELRSCTLGLGSSTFVGVGAGAGVGRGAWGVVMVAVGAALVRC
jgi:NAD(P)-dependent dehydrogenase (short-subunit alcohol dehydrogenase family)